MAPLRSLAQQAHNDAPLVFDYNSYLVDDEFDADDGYAEAFVADQAHGPLAHRGRE